MQSKDIKNRGKLFYTIGFYITVILILSFFLFPIFWVIVSSFKTRTQIFSPSPFGFFLPTLSNYSKIIFHSQVPKIMFNSVVAATFNTGISLIIGFPCAYGISRYKVGGQSLPFTILSMRMLPPIVVTIPLFVIASHLRLIDTYIILPILYLTLNIPFVVWMLRSFLEEIPLEVEESALIDGCSTLGVMRRIIFPLMKTGIITTSIFCFIFAWNEFLFAMIFTRINARTITVQISCFICEHQILWGEMLSTASLAMLLPIILALFLQRFIIRGLTLGAIK